MRWGGCSTDLSGLMYGPLIYRDQTHYQKHWDNMSICLIVSTWGTKRVGVSVSESCLWNLSLLWRVEQVGWGWGDCETMTTEMWCLKVRFSGKWQTTRSSGPRIAIAAQQSRALSTSLCNITSMNLKVEALISFICELFVVWGFQKLDDTRVDEPTLWRLKTEYCISRWLCKGSAVSSYCRPDWMKARSDDRAAGSERRVYPLASRRDKGQWLWVHRQRLYEHLSAQLFVHANTIIPSSYSYPVWTYLYFNASNTWVWGKKRRTWKPVRLSLRSQWGSWWKPSSLFVNLFES